MIHTVSLLLLCGIEGIMDIPVVEPMPPTYMVKMCATSHTLATWKTESENQSVRKKYLQNGDPKAAA